MVWRKRDPPSTAGRRRYTINGEDAVVTPFDGEDAVVTPFDGEDAVVTVVSESNG